jgi:RNA polymerase sigma-70 factor (ECF subfamily)
MQGWGEGAISDEALAAEVAGGDPAALGALYRRYGAPTLNLVRRITGDHELAQDVTQETFTRVWLKADTFDGGRFRGWLFAIALNLTRSELARRRHGMVHLAPQEMEAVASKAESPYARLARVEEERTVAEAVQRLAPPLREVVVLKVYRQLTFAEIAQMTGTSAAALKLRFYRARIRLRDRLRRGRTPRPTARPR